MVVLADSPRPTQRQPQSYSLEVALSIPHSTGVNALAAVPGSRHLYTGGMDGMVRRYDLYASLNGDAGPSTSTSSAGGSGAGSRGGARTKPTQTSSELNLTAKPSGYMATSYSTPSASVSENKPPVLRGYWENEDEPAPGTSLLPAVKWGRRNEGPGKGSAVYSLAVQSRELWGVSGTAKGAINLFTIRHDEGQIRHVFRSSPDGSSTLGHRPTGAVSVLQLNNNEDRLMSGGWDGSVLEWDLHTGTSTRCFSGHTSQLSSLAFRPLSTTSASTAATATATGEDKVEGDLQDDIMDEDLAFPPAPAPVPETAGDVVPTADKPKPPSPKAASPESDNDPLFLEDGGSDEGEGEEDTDADGEPDVDTPEPGVALATLPLSAPTTTALPPRPKPLDVPLVTSSTHLPPASIDQDVFMTSAVNGQVFLWDRRVPAATGGVQRLADATGGDGTKSRSCCSAIWAPTGNEIVLGRHNSTMEIYDLRSPTLTVRSLTLPRPSGPITALRYLGPGSRWILSGSEDNLRLWDMDLVAAYDGVGIRGGKRAYQVIPRGSGGVISQLYVDPTSKFVIAASGNRGWEGTSSDNVVVYAVAPVY